MKKFLPLLALPLLVLLVSIFMLPGQDTAGGSSTQSAGRAQTPAAEPVSNRLAQFTSLWSNAGSPGTEATNPFDQLWTRLISPADQNGAGDDTQDQLRKLMQEQPYYLKRIISLYQKEQSPQIREIIRNLLSGIRSPEVFTLSRQLASSAESEQRIMGLIMLRDLNIYPQEELQLIRLSLNNEQQAAVILQALAALKPPAVPDAPASRIDAKTTKDIISKLQSLTQNADPAVRSQSVLQLAQWDKNDSSLNYFSAALNDPVASVRQTAIFALAQSGTNADAVKQLLNGVINNAGENIAIKTSAKQVLEAMSVKQLSTLEVAEQRKTQA
ncbi:HEAT repeat domain-containing protein [Undibacterium sp. Ji83W]|uniref:HEAT repeat domain-containing protein n=1 Tax=Undibacterium sp. Ji83W TaxID=3413043 RepID=UPI003BF032A8